MVFDIYDTIKLSKKGKRRMHKKFGKNCFDEDSFSVECVTGDTCHIQSWTTDRNFVVTKDELQCFNLEAHDISFYHSVENSELKIKSLTVNKEKHLTTVVFDSVNYGKNVFLAKANEKDDYDVSVGVALCIAYRLFGSKTKFHKFIKQIEKLKKEREKL